MILFFSPKVPDFVFVGESPVPVPPKSARPAVQAAEAPAAALQAPAQVAPATPPTPSPPQKSDGPAAGHQSMASVCLRMFKVIWLLLQLEGYHFFGAMYFFLQVSEKQIQDGDVYITEKNLVCFLAISDCYVHL